MGLGLQEPLEANHRATDALVTGDPETRKRHFSRRDDGSAAGRRGRLRPRRS
jgi:hypothetical protein